MSNERKINGLRTNKFNGFLKYAALITYLIGTLVASVWWASSVSTTLEHQSKNQVKAEEHRARIEKQIADGMADRYTGDDAYTDWERQGKRDQGQDNRINELHTKP